MTINNYLSRCSALLGDTVGEETLLSWLAEIENTVIREIKETHFAGESYDSPCAENGGREAALTVVDPYSSLYIDYAVMKNDLFLRDIQRYMNSASVFHNSYSAYADYVNRTNMPLGEKKIEV